jgi:hypothetical protein
MFAEHFADFTAIFYITMKPGFGAFSQSYFCKNIGLPYWDLSP